MGWAMTRSMAPGPWKRLIQSQIETQVARALIEGRAAHGDSLEEVIPAARARGLRFR